MKDLQHIIETSTSVKQAAERYLGYGGGSAHKKMRAIIEESGIDTSHFQTRRKLKTIEKVCPVCDTKFKTKNYGNHKEKKTCSKSCSNTYFRKNWSSKYGKYTYRDRALENKPNCCSSCGDDRLYVLQVHHIDGDRSNNKLENLEILCANCHLEKHHLERTK